MAVAVLVAFGHAAAAQSRSGFTGKPLWSVEIPSGPAYPPVVSGGRVVVATSGGQLLAKRISDGGEAWRVDLEATAPLAADAEIVLVPVAGAVRALSSTTGEERWTLTVPKVTAPPLAKGGWVILATGDELIALSAADGDEIWRTTIPSVEERPAIDGDHLYVPIADGRIVALALESGSLLWEARVGANPTEPFPYGDRIYFGANETHVVCLDASDGSEKWAFPIGAGLRGRAAADASHVYTASMDNLLRAFNRANGSLKWHQDLGYRPLSGPILAGASIAVPGRSATIQIFTAAGGKAEPLTLPDPPVTAPAFAEATARQAAFAKATARQAAFAEAKGNGTTEPEWFGGVVLATVTGNPGKPWLLNLTGQPPPAMPAPSPLTLLPGEVLPPMRPPG